MPQKGKISPEEKVEIVQRYLRGEVSQRDAAALVGVAWRTLRDWLRIYQSEGASGLMVADKNQRYSPELKASAVKEYLSGAGSQATICKKYKIRSTRQLRNWVKMYNAHGDFNSWKGSGGGSYMKQGRNTTQEERIAIARDCIANGKNYGEMALKYQVSYQQVRTWTLRFEELGEAGLEDRRGKRKKDQTPRSELEKAQIEIEQLKHKLYLAEMERDLLKKLDEIERGNASLK